MASKTLTCRLVTPTQQLLNEAVTSATIPAWDGLIGVLPGHAPLVAQLGAGEFRVEFPRENKETPERSYFIAGGFVQVNGDQLILLVDEAVPAEELLESDARAELAEAEARTVDPADPDRAKAAEDLRSTRDRARAKLRLAQSRRGKGI